MTKQRDLKRRVRERQAKTGESYVTARRQVREKNAAGAVPVVELIDASEDAARLGLRCRAHVWPALAPRVDVVAALTRLRDVLIATDEDPATRRFRATVLRGEQPETLEYPAIDYRETARRFLQRAKAGLGGVSPNGLMMAVDIGGVMVLFVLSLTPTTLVVREPAVLLMTPEDPHPWRIDVPATR